MSDGGFILIYLVSVFIASVSQVLLKQSADKPYESKIKEYLNWRVIMAYTLFFGAALLSIVGYSRLELSLGAALESAGYIFILGMGVLILKEKLSAKKVAGVMLIVVGIVLASIFR
ncbi:MAG: multidrug ABC transporter [Peptococcaceae bacterium]|nr:multidrug ABC transporter [Peptococcaceae bacterium]